MLYDPRYAGWSGVLYPASVGDQAAAIWTSLPFVEIYSFSLTMAYVCFSI